MAKSYNFSNLPSLRRSRSGFSEPHTVMTSLNVGDFIPVSVVEVNPGDTWICNAELLLRATSPYYRPIMSGMSVDTVSFFVPRRLCYKDFGSIFGEASPKPYIETVNHMNPYFETKQIVSPNSIADYLNFAVGQIPAGATVDIFRAFALCWNEWVRNQNVSYECYVYDDDVVHETEVLNDQPWSPTNYTGMPPKVMKINDYFTTAMPNTQKYPTPSVLPLGTSAPVISDGIMRFSNSDGDGDVRLRPGSTLSGATTVDASLYNSDVDATLESTDNLVYSGGLKVDLSDATASNIQDFRVSAVLQQIRERDLRYGSRYTEFLSAAFGVYNPDGVLQRPLWLGSHRSIVDVQQVPQTSGSTESSPQGNMAGYTVSRSKHYFRKAFAEFGYIITCMCVRQQHLYQQGVPRMYSRHSRTDFYDTAFNGIGMQAIYESEIFATDGTSTGANGDTLRDNTKIFGYQEPFAEYKFIPNIVTGQLRSGVANSLDLYHLADYFAEAPTLSESFIHENSDNVDRALNSPSYEGDVRGLDNFIVRFDYDTTVYHVMPVHSDPGIRKV